MGGMFSTFLSKFSPQAKPMLYMEKSPTASSRKASQFLRHGNVCKNMY
jgi:hypothetical protein